MSENIQVLALEADKAAENIKASSLGDLKSLAETMRLIHEESEIALFEFDAAMAPALKILDEIKKKHDDWIAAGMPVDRPKNVKPLKLVPRKRF